MTGTEYANLVALYVSRRFAARGLRAGGEIVPIGDSSVMPQLVWTVTPRRSSMRASRVAGQLAPPMATRCRLGTSAPVASRWSSRPSHTVGTPVATVT